MPLARLKTKTTRDILWIYLLKLLKEKKTYAYAIRKKLGERFGFEPALVTSYVVLYRLEKGGYVRTVWKENKKYYEITKNGEALYAEGVDHLKSLVKRLE